MFPKIFQENRRRLHPEGTVREQRLAAREGEREDQRDVLRRELLQRV